MVVGRWCLGRWLVLVAVFVVAALGVAGVAGLVRTGSAAVGHAAAHRPVRVTVAGGCPSRLGGADGVRNSGAGLAREFTPGHPDAALVCRYLPDSGQLRVGVAVLYRAVTLDAVQAGTLAGSLDRIRVGTDNGGPHSCPPRSTANVLVFGYPHRPDVDVWFLEGCSSVDNGFRHADEVGNPPFYLGFEPVVDQLAPPCPIPSTVHTDPGAMRFFCGSAPNRR